MTDGKCSTVIFLVMLIFIVVSWKAHRNAECKADGGVLVSSTGGYACVKPAK